MSDYWQWLRDLKPGDRVFESCPVNTGWARGTRYTLATVDRVTPGGQIVVGKKRYTSRGHMIGSNSGTIRNPNDPETIKTAERCNAHAAIAEAQDRMRAACYRMERINSDHLEVSELEAVAIACETAIAIADRRRAKEAART